MAKRASVPKFGAWDGDNAGYTVYFEKVRENKGATAPPLHRPFNPNDPEEDAPPRLLTTPTASNRPVSSRGGHRATQQQHHHHHHRVGSSSSVASQPVGFQSKFAPPPQYYQRPQPSLQYHDPAGQHGGDHGHHYRPASQHGDDHGHHYRPASQHGGDHGQHNRPAGQQKPHETRQQQKPARVQGARPRTVAVPKFGAWDEQSAAAQGFTVQFERVKRDREVARGAPMLRRRMPSPESYAHARRSRHAPTPFYSKMFGCFLQHPHTRD
uniref:Uncharacterized protein n=1 Tax=Avena sativa TaxID=4498 RepID=A0ACD5ZF38_AVESA